MLNSLKSKWLLISLDVLLFAVLVLGFINIIQKPALPFKVDSSSLKVTEINNSLVDIKTGDVLIGIGNEMIYNYKSIEYICDYFRVSNSVDVTIGSGTGVKKVSVKFISYYDDFYLVIYCFVIAVFWLIAVFVMKNRQDSVGYVFHFTAVSTSLYIGLTTGNINLFGNFLDILIRVLYDASEIFLGVFMLHFSMEFPRKKAVNNKIIRIIPYLAGTILLAIVSYLMYPSVIAKQPLTTIFDIYIVFRLYLIDLPFILFILIGIASITHSYIKFKDALERRKLRWIFFGLFVVPMNYIFLYLLPQIIFGHSFMPEWTMILITAIAPITFFISIVRYRILDIDFIISRGTVFSVLILAFVAIFNAVEWSVIHLMGLGIRQETILPTIIAAIIISVIYEPFRRNLQGFIDKRFFREKYNLTKAREKINSELGQCFSIEQTGEVILNNTKMIINVDSMSFLIYNNKENNIKYIGNHNFSIDYTMLMPFLSYLRENVVISLLARSNTLEDDIEFTDLQPFFTELTGFNLVIPALTEDKSNSCFLMLSQKKSKLKYTFEEIDTLKKNIILAAHTIQKIILQNELSLKYEENKRLTELSKMKSFFVSSVSHELKTPLTSIKLFAELLQLNKGIPANKQDEYLSIIQNECDRLNRLINNVLDYSKIERGIKQYNFEKLDLNDIITTVMNVMNNQFTNNRFSVETELHREPLIINADKDAIIEIFINLLSNSIKYSEENRFIKVRTYSDNEYQVTVISDKGIGMSPEDLEHIFEAFYRAKSEQTSHIGGAGIGLSLVYSIVQAHGGKIDAESEIGRGSTFTLKFPKG